MSFIIDGNLQLQQYLATNDVDSIIIKNITPDENQPLFQDNIWKNLQAKTIEVNFSIINVQSFPLCDNFTIKDSVIYGLAGRDINTSPIDIRFDNCIFLEMSQFNPFPFNYVRCEKLVIKNCTSYMHILSYITIANPEMVIDVSYNSFCELKQNDLIACEEFLRSRVKSIIFPKDNCLYRRDKKITSLNVQSSDKLNFKFLIFDQCYINITDEDVFSEIETLTFKKCTIDRFTNKNLKVKKLFYIDCKFETEEAYPFYFDNMFQIATMDCPEEVNKKLLDIIASKKLSSLLVVDIPSTVQLSLPNVIHEIAEVNCLYIDRESVADNFKAVYEEAKEHKDLINELFMDSSEAAKTHKNIINLDINMNTVTVKNILLPTTDYKLDEATYKSIIDISKENYVRSEDYSVSVVMADKRYYFTMKKEQIFSFIQRVIAAYDVTDIRIEDPAGYLYLIDKKGQLKLAPNNIHLGEIYAKAVNSSTSLRTMQDETQIHSVLQEQYIYLKSKVDANPPLEIPSVFKKLNAISSLASKSKSGKQFQNISFTSLIPDYLKNYLVFFGSVILGTITSNVTDDEVLYGAFITQDDNHSMLLNHYITTFINEIPNKSVKKVGTDYHISFTHDNITQHLVIIGRKFTNAIQVLASVMLPAEGILYYNDNYYVTNNFITALERTSNIIMLEDLSKEYVHHLLHYVSKGFRVEVPVEVEFPKYPAAKLYKDDVKLNSSADYLYYLENVDGQKLIAMADLRNLYKNGKEDTSTYEFVNLSELENYDHYMASLGSNHELYSWDNWKYIHSVDEVQRLPLLFN
jgi:hypothetical protein